jgi:hypothetical protein
VDELTMGISDVVRGHDLWPATAAQVAVMAALGGPAPTYWHGPLLLDRSGQRLAKRSGSEGLADLREQGLDGPAVVGLLAGELDLVEQGSRISAAELLQELKNQNFILNRSRSSLLASSPPSSDPKLDFEVPSLEDPTPQDSSLLKQTGPDPRREASIPPDSTGQDSTEQRFRFQERLRNLVADQLASNQSAPNGEAP